MILSSQSSSSSSRVMWYYQWQMDRLRRWKAECHCHLNLSKPLQLNVIWKPFKDTWSNKRRRRIERSSQRLPRVGTRLTSSKIWKWSAACLTRSSTSKIRLPVPIAEQTHNRWSSLSSRHRGGSYRWWIQQQSTMPRKARRSRLISQTMIRYQGQRRI